MCILSEAGGASYGSKAAAEKDGLPTAKIMGELLVTAELTRRGPQVPVRAVHQAGERRRHGARVPGPHCAGVLLDRGRVGRLGAPGRFVKLKLRCTDCTLRMQYRKNIFMTHDTKRYTCRKHKQHTMEQQTQTQVVSRKSCRGRNNVPAHPRTACLHRQPL